MKKEKVLVQDHNGVFLEIFKKELTDEFQFVETALRDNNQTKFIDFNRFVYVVYNKSELIEFLSLEKRGRTILVCLFNEQLYTNSSLIEEIFDLVSLDGYKTKRDIIKDLKGHFKNTSQSSLIDNNSSYNSKSQTQFHNFFKTVLYFV